MLKQQLSAAFMISIFIGVLGLFYATSISRLADTLADFHCEEGEVLTHNQYQGTDDSQQGNSIQYYCQNAVGDTVAIPIWRMILSMFLLSMGVFVILGIGIYLYNIGLLGFVLEDDD